LRDDQKNSPALVAALDGGTAVRRIQLKQPCGPYRDPLESRTIHCFRGGPATRALGGAGKDWTHEDTELTNSAQLVRRHTENAADRDLTLPPRACPEFAGNLADVHHVHPMVSGQCVGYARDETYVLNRFPSSDGVRGTQVQTLTF